MNRYVKTNYVFEPFKMAKQQRTNQTIKYKLMYPAGLPSGLRRQIQEIFSIEISGEQMYVCVGSNPTPVRSFWALRSISWIKNTAKPKAVLLLKAERYKDPTWELSIETFVTPECAWVQNLPLSEQKNQNDASREMYFFALTKLVVDDQLIISKMKFQKLETICENKLRIWTIQNGKTTANNPICNVHYNLQGRMAERSKAPDSRILLARDFWYTNVCVGSNPTPVRNF